VIEINPIVADPEMAEVLALGGEVLLVRRAARVVDHNPRRRRG
jgi:hypothetical protein